MPVEITRMGDRIHLRSPYDPDVVSRCKSLSGGFVKASKTWTFPLSTDMCRVLREVFPDLRVAAPLWDWAREAMAKEKAMAKLGASLDGGGVTLEKLGPELRDRVSTRPYQMAAARFIADGRAVGVMDTPGLGKTTETIAGIVESGVPGPYLIVAPQTSLDTVWEREIQTCLPGATVVVAGLSGMNRPRRADFLSEALSGQRSPANTWVIINIEMIRAKGWWVCEQSTTKGGPACGGMWISSDKPKAVVVDCGHDPKKIKSLNEFEYPDLFSARWGAIVMDECQRSIIRGSGVPTQTRRGAKLLEIRPDGLRIALSGTPMRGKPHRLFGTLNWLDSKTYSGFWGWAGRFFEVTEGGYAGARSIGALRADREKILFQSLSGIIIRRTKAEVSPELPPKAYMDNLTPEERGQLTPAIWLNMDPKQEKAYRQMLKSGSAIVEGGSLNAIGILAELTRLKQLANCYAKMDRIHHPETRRKATAQEISEWNAEDRLYGWDGPTLDGGWVIQPAWDEDVVMPILPSNKFAWIIQFLTDLSIIDGDEAPTGKVAIVSQFTRHLVLLEEILNKLGLKTLSITGKVSGKQRTRAQDLFNDMGSGYQVMLLNTMAGGVAITLDAADDMIFLDETFVPDDQDQAEDRINNRRPEEKVATRRYWYLKSLGTIDEAIARTNMDADVAQKRILDDRRGIPYLKRVLQYMKAA